MHFTKDKLAKMAVVFTVVLLGSGMAMADLKGTISGPPDLSTNPGYFDDFGR